VRRMKKEMIYLPKKILWKMERMVSEEGLIEEILIKNN
jgi:hypothetical protein